MDARYPNLIPNFGRNNEVNKGSRMTNQRSGAQLNKHYSNSVSVGNDNEDWVKRLKNGYSLMQKNRITADPYGSLNVRDISISGTRLRQKHQSQLNVYDTSSKGALVNKSKTKHRSPQTVDPET